MNDSRLPGFYRLSLAERIDALTARGWLDPADATALKHGRHVLPLRAADRMIENVVATFGLPLGIAPNFVVDGREHVVPLVVEEPSIVAALANAAHLARAGGGFTTRCEESLAIGQIHVCDIDDVDASMQRLSAERQALIATANEIHPRLVARGGGVRDIETHPLTLGDGRRLVVVHVLVDTCDAMGANLVNTLCEALAPEIATLAGGRTVLRILSNLNDRSLVSATVRYRLDALGEDRQTARRARDAIVLANDIALADPYRAATHNKGIMNGIDSLAIATGNDWRAIEAGAHAYAATAGRYSALTRWSITPDGDLEGRLRLPLKVATVGGSVDVNPAAGIGLRLAGVASAGELARLMAAVGLAQNFAAIRALVTAGIQRGHMRLHARAVAGAAGVPDALFDDVVDELIDSGEIKDWKAREILASRQTADAPAGVAAAGKVILFGEHAVVYGRHALALPIERGIVARAEPADSMSITIPAWGIDLALDGSGGIGEAVALIARELGIDAAFRVHADARLPRAMGLGSSAALAVAVTRALAAAFEVDVDDARVNAIAFECEKLAHGTPSGIDNTIATYAIPLLFRRDSTLERTPITLEAAPPFVIGMSNTPGSTLQQVAAVRNRRDRWPAHFDALFDEIDALALHGRDALLAGDFGGLGSLMNICHGLLNAIGVSTPELETMVDVARNAGATGAKLTGAGGGGSMIAACPGRVDEVRRALEAAGFACISLADEAS